MVGVNTTFNVVTRKGEIMLADIAFPPLGYRIIFNESSMSPPPTRPMMTEVSHFGRFRMNEPARTFLPMRVMVATGPTRFDGDSDEDNLTLS
jgi:hypothetical protein